MTMYALTTYAGVKVNVGEPIYLKLYISLFKNLSFVFFLLFWRFWAHILFLNRVFGLSGWKDILDIF